MLELKSKLKQIKLRLKNMINYIWTLLGELPRCPMIQTLKWEQLLLKMVTLFRWAGTVLLQAFLITVRIPQLGIHFLLLYTLKLMLYVSWLVLARMDKVLPSTLRYLLVRNVLSLSSNLVLIMSWLDKHMRRIWWGIQS